jgi:hypothetical protein
MSTFSRTHQFASGAAAFLPAGGHNIHGRKVAHIWSDDGVAFTLRITRPDGAAIDLNVPATPANHWETPLHPDETFSIQASTAAGSNINVLVI